MYNEKYHLTFIHYQILEQVNLNLNLDPNHLTSDIGLHCANQSSPPAELNLARQQNSNPPLHPHQTHHPLFLTTKQQNRPPSTSAHSSQSTPPSA